MATGRKKRGKRMVTAPVRLTEETHLRVKTLSEMWNVTISEAIDAVIKQHVPEVDEEIRRQKEVKRKFELLKPKQN